MKAVVETLFPTPVYFSNLEREFSKKEKNLIIQYENNSYKNISNAMSTNTHVLETETFKKLKEELLIRVQHYFSNVLCYENITPYITQSWLNYTKKNEHHHSHTHLNSFMSGVLYVNADKTNDSLTFLNYEYKQINPQIRENNIFNCSSYHFPVETGDIVLFPSSLTHMVRTLKQDDTRISLSFNIFIKGILGNEKQLTELVLK
jgi:uncharacterized protein (TIGR02466 family)